MDGDKLIRMTDDEWRGYITGILEGIRSDLIEVKTEQKECNSSINGLRAKTARNSGAIAAVVSIVGTFIGALLKNIIGVK